MDHDPPNLSIRQSPAMQSRVARLKARLHCDSSSEVVRRALEFYEKLLDADEVHVTISGQQQRVLLP